MTVGFAYFFSRAGQAPRLVAAYAGARKSSQMSSCWYVPSGPAKTTSAFAETSLQLFRRCFFEYDAAVHSAGLPFAGTPAVHAGLA